MTEMDKATRREPRYIHGEPSDESGWIRVSPFDEARRRALWVRVKAGTIEFCAGREGDDSYAVLHLDGTTDKPNLEALMECAERSVYAIEGGMFFVATTVETGGGDE